jgi:hypothetical protein
MPLISRLNALMLLKFNVLILFCTLHGAGSLLFHDLWRKNFNFGQTTPAYFAIH